MYLNLDTMHDVVGQSGVAAGQHVAEFSSSHVKHCGMSETKVNQLREHFYDNGGLGTVESRHSSQQRVHREGRSQVLSDVSLPGNLRTANVQSEKMRFRKEKRHVFLFGSFRGDWSRMAFSNGQTPPSDYYLIRSVTGTLFLA